MMNSDSEDPASTSSSGSQTPLLSSSEHRVVLIGGHNAWEWAFLSLCIPNSIILMASCGFALTECATEWRFEDINCVFEVEVCIICGLSLIFALYGVFAEHQFDIYLHSVLIFFAIVYSFVSWTAEKEFLINLVLNCCAAILWTVCFFLGLRATTVPDWMEFRIIGVSDPLAAMYKQVCYFLVVLKFDSIFLVFVSVSSTYILHRYSMRTFILLGLVTLYSAVSWTSGKAAQVPGSYFATVSGTCKSVYVVSKVKVLKEDMYLSFGFLVLTIAYPAFVAYQCFELLVSVERSEEMFYYSAFVLQLFVVGTKLHLATHMRKTWLTFGYGLNTRSFNDLVTRDSSSLLAHSRAAMFH